MADKSEPDAMLAFFDARIAAWVAAKESYLKAASLGTLGQSGEADLSGIAAATGTLRTPIDLPVGALRSKSIPDAIKLYLAAARRKQTVKEIAAGLKEGGLVTTAENFEATVTGALHRLKKDDIVLRFRDGWDLAESYPDHIRNKLENNAKQKTGTSTSTKKRGLKSNASRAKPPSKPKAPFDKKPAGEGIERRALEFLDAISGRASDPEGVAKAIGVEPRFASQALGRLAARGTIIKHQDGRYSLRPAKPEAAKAS